MAPRLLYSDRLTIVSECYAGEARILDIGSGPGVLLTRFVEANAETSGVAVDLGSSLMTIRHPRITPVPFDLRGLFANAQLPLPDASFDLVMATEVLEHMMYPEMILAEAYRLLKPDGKLLITVPNVASLEKRASLLLGSGRDTLGICGIVYEHANDHIRWFTFRALKHLLERTGFEVIQRRAADFPLKINRIGAGRILCAIIPSLAEKIIVKARKLPVKHYTVQMYACPLHQRGMPIHLDNRCADPLPYELICQQCRFVWTR